MPYHLAPWTAAPFFSRKIPPQPLDQLLEEADHHQGNQLPETHRQADHHHYLGDLIRQRVQHFAQIGNLVEMAGDETVQRIGHAGQHQYAEGPIEQLRPLFAHQIQRGEHRQQQQPKYGQGIGDRHLQFHVEYFHLIRPSRVLATASRKHLVSCFCYQSSRYPVEEVNVRRISFNTSARGLRSATQRTSMVSWIS